MPRQNMFRQHKLILYRLKRSYNSEITFVYIGDQDFDVTTGSVTQVNYNIVVKRAIVLPMKEIRDFAYDLSYIAANKNFTYGGFYDSNNRIVIVENKDVHIKNTKTVLQINENWLADYRGYEYHVKSVSPLEIPGHTLIILTGVSNDTVIERSEAVVEPVRTRINVTTGLTEQVL